MAIWRSVDVEARFGGPLDETGITLDAIERLVAQEAPEFDQLDFKGKHYGRAEGQESRWGPEQEFAKDVAALANHRGGVIVLGVSTTNGVASGLTPLRGILSPEAEEQRLRQALLNYLAPYHDCLFVWVPAADEEWFLTVVVPQSVRSPHAVLGLRGDARRPLYYPLRHGADTAWMTEAEVADRYRRRLTFREDEAERIDRVVEGGRQALRRAEGIWLYSAAVPEIQSYGRLDANSVREIEEWYRNAGMASPMKRLLRAYGRGIPAPGRVTFTGSLSSVKADESAISDAYTELHVDGSAFAAVPICSRTDDEGPRRRQVGEMTLTDDTFLLTDIILTWCAHRASAWGTATVRSGFMDADTPSGLLEAPISLVNYEYGSLHRVAGTREVDGRPESTVVVDLGVIDVVQQRLVVTFAVAAELLQWFGVSEPRQVRPDGSVLPILFEDHYWTEQWARENGVAVAPY